MSTWTVAQLDRLREVAALRRDLTASLDQIAHNTITAIETNVLDCPEIWNYQRRVIEGAVIVTYEVRQPGERDWQPFRLVRLT
ncbi:MAG TPA: hypothetical protein VGW38_23860 [Chloroflexota bacterium]|nr:hypothetical protein [Chloroflexota bacterium]